MKIIIKKRKMSVFYFWSCDGIQIFSVDLVLDLLIGQDLILFFFQKFINAKMAIPTASMVIVILYTSPVLLGYSLSW